MQGRLAGQLALNILKGENPDDIEVLNTGTNELMFDYNELKRFDISLDSLPENSRIINQPPPFYALSKGQLWGGFGFMTVFTVFLLAMFALSSYSFIYVALVNIPKVIFN